MWAAGSYAEPLQGDEGPYRYVIEEEEVEVGRNAAGDLTWRSKLRPYTIFLSAASVFFFPAGTRTLWTPTLTGSQQTTRGRVSGVDTYW